MSIDNAKNFAKATVAAGHNSSDTSIALLSGNGALLPVAPFNVVWWNSTDFTDPSDDPNVEIVRVTAGGGGGGGDTLTVTRGQESTSASTKNTAGKTYKMAAPLTAKVINTDILAAAWTSLAFVNGANQNFSLASAIIGAGGIIRGLITAPTLAFNIGGFTNGVAGMILELWNSTALAMTINNQDAGSSAGNKIYTNTGANVTIGSTHGGFARFVYEPSFGLWVLTGTQGT